MHFNKHYTRILVLACSLLLTGFDGFRCTDEDSSDESGGESTNARIRVEDEQKISETSGGFNLSLIHI